MWSTRRLGGRLDQTGRLGLGDAELNAAKSLDRLDNGAAPV